MKFYIALFCLTTCITTNAAQVAKAFSKHESINSELNKALWDMIGLNDTKKIKKLFEGDTIPNVNGECPYKDGGSAPIGRLLCGVSTLYNTHINSIKNFTLLTWVLLHSEKSAPILIDYIADINKKNLDGTTTLQRASYVGHNDTLTLLIERNAKLDLQDLGGNTALIWAACDLNYSAIQTLIAAGANKEIKNNHQKTALDCAEAEACASFTSQRSYYEAAMKQYHQAVADGEAERDRYAAEKQAALERIQNFVTVQDLAAIVCGYAYGVLPRDLPKDLPEEKSWLATHCTIQ